MTRKIDFLVREPHHRDHAKPIYDDLPDEYRGQFVDDPNEIRSEIVATFCYRDLKAVGSLGLKAIYSDHGAGFYFDTVHPSYAGSVTGRENVILRQSPNETHAEIERNVLSCPVEVVGVPKMDKWANFPQSRRPYRRKKIVVSFHWDCMVSWATRSAWKHYIEYLWQLKDKYEVYGHGHPRILNKLTKYYRKQGIKTIDNFSWVMQKADLYINDSSSTLFEFAFTGKPVVLLNSPVYRKDVELSGCPRFWRYANIGPQVDEPRDLLAAVNEAFEYPEKYEAEKQKAVKSIFTYTQGESTQKAVEAIIKHIV